MGKNRRGTSSQDAAIEEKRRKRAEEKALIEDSPFRNVVLKEKTDKVSRNKGKVAPQRPKHQASRKPSEIVQGYNPNADFADILASWETTGSPYALPDRKRAEEIKKSQTSFADIFAAWEGRSNPKKPASEIKRASEPYRPQKSFADILDQYEGKPRASEPSVSENKKPAKKVSSTPYERKSSEYKGTKDFGEILDSYEGKSSSTFIPSDGKKVVDKVEKASFFKKMDEDDERPGNVAWSVFGDNHPIERVEETKEKPVETPVENKYERVSKRYEPKKDFGEILSEYGREKSTSHPVEPEKPVKKAVQKEVEKPTFFKKMDEDDERPDTVTWSVFGDNHPIERKAPEPVVEEKREPVEVIPERRSTYEPKRDFGKILSSYEKERAESAPVKKEAEVVLEEKKDVGPLFRKMDEDDERPRSVAWSIFGDNHPIERKPVEEVKVESEPVKEVERPKVHAPVRRSSLFRESVGSLEQKSFEELFREKGELEKSARKKTITELRTMLPEVFIDLHGMKQDEAERELGRFLDEAVSEKLEKVSIIHGKGLHSEDGQGVLKALALRILDEKGIAREVYSPKEQYGGEGVLWVILKSEA